MYSSDIGIVSGILLGNENTRTTIRNFGVTLSFAAGSIAVTAIVWLIDSSVLGTADATPAIEWVRVGTLIFSYAVLSGILVDSLRWIGARLLRDNPLIRRQARQTFKHRLT